MCSGRYCDAERKSIPLYNKLPSILGEHGRYDNPERVKRGIVPCLGVCAGGPLVVIYPDGDWYHHVDEALMARIVDEHIDQNKPISDHIFHRIETDDSVDQASTDSP